jgi:hypothetical protein
MKSKATNYILAAAMVIVWGLIIYRVVDALSDNDDVPISALPLPNSKEPLNDYALVKDTGTLNLNYRDPFNDADLTKDTVQIPVKKLITTRKPANNVFNSSVSKPAINWGFIKYSGYIRNPKTKKLIALLNINGKSLMLSEGESAEQVKLLKNLKDSVKVTYNNRTKFITVNTGL